MKEYSVTVLGCLNLSLVGGKYLFRKCQRNHQVITNNTLFFLQSALFPPYAYLIEKYWNALFLCEDTHLKFVLPGS